MATHAKHTDAPRTKRSHALSTARTQFKAGDKVEYDGKLAKVVQFGFLEIPTNPGEDTQFSDELVATLQLPGLDENNQPTGRMEYAYNVPAGEITSLKDNPKRQRSLEMEFNQYFGDPKPVAEEVQYNKPNLKGVGHEGRQPSKGTVTTKEPRSTAPRNVASEMKDGGVVDTSKSSKSSKKSTRRRAAR